MKRLPEDYVEFIGEGVMSNFDGKIAYDTAEKIKDEKLFSRYAGMNFNGKVWYEDESWHCEVWVYGSVRDTISKDSLEDLMWNVGEEFGHD